MLWGSKRTGPDLARLGERYSDDWHVLHLSNPRHVVPESVMPAYPFLTETQLRTGDLPGRLAALRAVGVPYTDDMIGNAARDAYGQATPDSAQAGETRTRYGEATAIRAFDGNPGIVTEMDALVAYLQVLGRLTDVAVRPQQTTEALQ
jgi:cytochrome c oxidase cbb3-type subunit 2